VLIFNNAVSNDDDDDAFFKKMLSFLSFNQIMIINQSIDQSINQ
jgi:hypothetical protein